MTVAAGEQNAPGDTPTYDAAVDRRRLPVGIQTFREIREEGYYYVDKTPYARQLANDAGKHYFLSRPRRFGKSLFVDTLKELYESSESLFRGLAVHDVWDWSKRHPVVRLSFAGGQLQAGRASSTRARCGSLRQPSAGPACRAPRSPRRRGVSPTCWRRCTSGRVRAPSCW